MPAFYNNGRYLLQLCGSNVLCIMNTFFQHIGVHKYTWYKPRMGKDNVLADYLSRIVIDPDES